VQKISKLLCLALLFYFHKEIALGLAKFWVYVGPKVNLLLIVKPIPTENITTKFVVIQAFKLLAQGIKKNEIKFKKLSTY
jgi:hypothetical protein